MRGQDIGRSLYFLRWHAGAAGPETSAGLIEANGLLYPLRAVNHHIISWVSWTYLR